MAVVNATITQLGADAVAIAWSGMALNDTGQPIELAAHYDRSVEVQGTFGAGGAVDFEGSNGGVNYAVLHDIWNNAVSFSAAGLAAPAEAVRYVRPHVTGGDGTTAVDVIVFARKTAR